uniref:Branched-chain-amino-acid aminotransferase n=1 Tax=Kalanchoe fedtschenkoi TaxID=63787 RepID=A0A7N0T4E7_KALFE
MVALRALIRSSTAAAAAPVPFGASKSSGSFKIRPAASLAGASSRDPSELYSDEESIEGVNWDKLGFSLTPTDYMYTMKCGKDETFERGGLAPFRNVGLSPASGVLNYGQGIFEGMKAQRRKDGRIVLFRPDLNAKRMQLGAERMCMPSPSAQQFIQAVKDTTLANKRWVPPFGKGSLYMRPMLLGSGAMLGVGPAPEYTYLIYASPVGNYYKEGSAPLKLYVEDELHRAYQGGTGAVKSITNYGPVLRAMTEAKKRGFSDVLYLDPVHKRNIEEVSASNIFVIKGDTVSTPATSGTILDGVTRRSVLEIARDIGYKVEERAIPVDELSDADEVFCTGTAVGVAPVGSITYKNNRIEYEARNPSVAGQLQAALVGIQTGLVVDKNGWTVKIEE